MSVKHHVIQKLPLYADDGIIQLNKLKQAVCPGKKVLYKQ